MNHMTHSHKSAWLSCALLSCLLSGAVQAQNAAASPRESNASANPRDTSDSNELLLTDEPVVYTAAKTLQRISDSPAAVTVITEEQIQSSGATSIPELLRSVPGVDVMEPNKSQANVSIRGFNQTFSNTLLVMVDGRAINEPILGNVFWNTEPLLLTRIKRIEIVRGPGSVLYGANAFNGVINIITKTPQEMAETKTPVSLVGAYGEHESAFTEGTYSTGKANDWALTLGAGYHATAGFGGKLSPAVDDRSEVPILTADLQKQLHHGSLLLSANNSDARADLSTEIVIPNADWHTNSVSLAYASAHEANPITAHAYGNFIRLVGNNFYAASNTYDLEVQQQRQLSARQSLVYGGSYRRDQNFSMITGPQKQQQQLYGLYLQDQYQLGPATNLFAGLRWDQHSVYGSQVSPRLSLVHHLSRDQSVRLSYGTAFRAPTFIETYLDLTQPLAPGLDLKLAGNLSLTPQKIASTEAGYRVDLRGGYAGLSLFYNRISDIIGTAPVQFAPSPPFPAGIPSEVQYQNQGTARAFGLELESGFQIKDGWHGLANYAYQDVRNDNGQPTNFSPKHKVNLVLESDARRRWTAYSAVHFVSDSVYAGAALRAYTTVDARIGYRVGGANQPWTVSIAATNLLDDHHREYADVLAAGSTTATAESMRRTLWLIAGGSF